MMAIAALGLVFAGCDLFESIGGGSSGSEPCVIKAKTIDGYDVEIIITRGSAPRAVLTPANGDYYVIRMNGVEISRGTITVAVDQIVFYPSNKGETFSMIYTGGSTDANFEDAIVILYELPIEGGGVAPVAPPSDGGSGANIAVTGVSLNSNTLPLVVGDTKTLTATVAPSNATNKAVTWTSSDTTKAIITGTGLSVTVTAVAAGTATITVKTIDGNFEKTCSVTVTEPVLVTSVSVSPSTLLILEGTKATLTAAVTPSNATKPAVTWSTSDANVATVSSAGLVTAVAVGSAAITATTVDGSDITASCVVTVYEIWTVDFVNTLEGVELQWTGIHRAKDQEITGNPMPFDQTSIENKAKAIRNAADNTPTNDVAITTGSTIPLTRYATVAGKLAGTNEAFDAIVITKIGDTSFNTLIDPSGNYMVAPYPTDNPTGTHFKYAVSYAIKNATESQPNGTWVLRDGRSGAVIEFTFYKGGSINGSVWQGGTPVARAYDTLPTITISTP